jgi:Rrf2 family protein
MAHLTNSVEYGIHCLLWLVYADEVRPSSRDLAELQGISPSFAAKIFQKLEKAGIVQSSEGVKGGYRLVQAPQDITVLALVDAIEGHKPLFKCQEIRGRCAIFDGEPPGWATKGHCAIHNVMLNAEKAMRDALEKETLFSLAKSLDGKAPRSFGKNVGAWLTDRRESRRSITKVRKE